jgi:hypothetical protein
MPITTEDAYNVWAAVWYETSGNFTRTVTEKPELELTQQAVAAIAAAFSAAHTANLWQLSAAQRAAIAGAAARLAEAANRLAASINPEPTDERQSLLQLQAICQRRLNEAMRFPKPAYSKHLQTTLDYCARRLQELDGFFEIRHQGYT